MQVTEKVREDDGDTQELVLTLSATADEVKEATDHFFKDIAQRDIPGFRKGKAPRKVLEQSVGGHRAAMGGVAETLINMKAFRAIDDADVIYLADPQFNVDADVEEGKPFTCTVSGPVAPTMKLTSYEGVAIEMPPDEATDAEVARELKALQDYYHSFEAIADAGHAAAYGEYVSVKLTVTNHDKPLRGLMNADRMIGLGTGDMPASFDEHLIGAKVGDVLDFDFEAKSDEEHPEYGDGELHAVVEVKEIRRCIVPEIGPELALKVGCADTDDLYAQMRRTINQHKDEELPRLMIDRAVEELTKRLDGDVPEYYIDFFRQDVTRELMQSLEQQGTSLQQWLLENQQNGEEIKEDVTREAMRRARIDCALEALCDELKFEVTDEDIERELESDTSENTREQWENACRMADLRKICRRSKATRWLVKHAEVTVVDDAETAA